ncbi:cystatin/monellin superfamily protein [Striga asiatica]|uniref:Cystatin/monellin superfamily protein n=1 Tax=Striga asiatica TaxID=4170 RepID=A0A5A7Q6R6_STRAF|nr:cystatin/monellin superfamily protein [Striga asiatica]
MISPYAWRIKKSSPPGVTSLCAKASRTTALLSDDHHKREPPRFTPVPPGGFEFSARFYPCITFTIEQPIASVIRLTCRRVRPPATRICLIFPTASHDNPGGPRQVNPSQHHAQAEPSSCRTSPNRRRVLLPSKVFQFRPPTTVVGSSERGRGEEEGNSRI